MTRSTMALAMVLSLAAPVCLAGEIGFVEDFSLGTDRPAALKQLIPGTEDYYYYNCLHLQNTAQLAEVDRLLKLWVERHGETVRVVEIRNRQALLKYETDEKGSLAYLTEKLKLHFNHQREIVGQQSSLPTSLDQKLISRETLTPRALANHPGTVDGFEHPALDWVIGLNLSGDQRRHLLARLTRPDHANLPKVILDDLKYQNSGGFGSHPVHAQLLLSQLEDLLKLEPGLLNQTNFVNAYLTKLQPSPDGDWRHDAKERQAYLDRLWEFVSRLAPAHNSLKAHVMYHRLVHDRALGVWDKDRFMTYIKLPRNAHYINPKYVDRREHRDYRADLNFDCQGFTLLPPIRDDEPVVRSYLMHFFVEEDSYKAYEEYVNDLYLKDCFAETKLVNGLGDAEKWFSMLTPERVQYLKDRIDLDFAETNKTLFGAAEDVALDIHVKNVKTLIVKVYQINAMNYYRANLREVDTDINLDGLVANEENVYTYEEAPIRRVTRHFALPSLKQRGTYIVEFIGGGKSSRALVRKGKLSYLVRTGSAGHVFTILDESAKKVADASLWVAGHEYRSEAPATAPATQPPAGGLADGTITVPFSNSPGAQPIIISQGDFACLDAFQHQSENYSLAAGIHVEREALLKQKKASVTLRPVLYLNGTPVSLSILEEVALVITSVDQEGVSTTKEAPAFKLAEDKESVYEFQVPENLARIAFTLKAKVQNLSQNKKVDLAAGAEFGLNNIDRTDKVEDLHLSHIRLPAAGGQVDGQYILDLLGRTGEPKADRPVQLELKHRDFRETVHVSLQTDKQGRVILGELKDITFFRATGPEKTTHTWYPVKDQHSYPANVHGKAGGAVYLPYMGSLKEPVPAEFSLLEVRGNTYVKDCFSSLKIKDGFLVIQDLPAGDYDLLMKPSGQSVGLTGTSVRVRLTEGAPGEGYVFGANRHLEERNTKPLQIVGVEADNDTVKITLANATKFSRVHVAATRYMQEYPVYPDLGRIAFLEPCLVGVVKPESAYLSGRNIGDEYRYILDRKYARKFPGNMLARPSLLLNPWAIRKTETAQQVATEGEAPQAAGVGAPGERRSFLGQGGAARAEGGFANLDFLSEQAAVLTNLAPDDKGVVTINRKDLGSHQQLHVLAVDPENTAYREVSLAEKKMDFLDLRLGDRGLDPKRHFTEQKQIGVVGKQAEFVLADITTSKFEAYDTLGKAYKLYVTLSNDPTLVEFSFILKWPTLKPEQKQELYSKYACHELNFFLSRKDPEFFTKVVQPYLRNKKDKTFMDRWLIGDDLSAYLKPWAYGQLNMVERILLAQRVKDELAARHVKDLYDLIPPDIERFNFLFKTALKGSALETADAFGLLKAQAEAAPESKLRSADMPAKPMVTGRTAGPAGTAAAATPAPVEAPPRSEPKADLARAEKAKEEAGKDRDMLEDKQLAEGLKKLPKDGKYWADDEARRRQARQFYRKLDKTEEWVENNYYHLPIEVQNGSLVPVNAFWRDYAKHDGKSPFFSVNLAEASRSFPEVMFALSVLDLPFDADKHQTDYKGATLTLKAGSPMVVFYKEIKEAKPAPEKTPILVSQNFFRHNDRYVFVNNEKMDKYVTEEFLIHTVYGCQVVVTNPTSSPQKLDILLQVPRGAIPVANTLQTRSVHIDLQPYNTQTVEYFFYFPFPGDYVHYPVHVAKNEMLIASCEPVTLKAVEKLSKIDKTSWEYISQNGTDDEVLDFLRQQNINRIDLEKIAFRMRDKAYFNSVIALLAGRHVYHHTLWSYGIKHNVVEAIREFLQHCDAFVSQCGSYIDCKLLTIDPVIRKSYQHMEYSPLVNARAHKLGKQRMILNDRFFEQYQRLLKVLSYRPQLDNDDLMAATYYMLLQDRVEEAQSFFIRVDAKKLATGIQHDYFTVHLDFYTPDHKLARGIATRYLDYPVDRWRKLFVNAVSQLDELEGKGPKVADDKDREQAQAKLAATEASFEFKVEARQVTLNYQNLKQARVNYYVMDIELLFSRNPFVQQYSGQFSFIRPNETQVVQLDEKKTAHTFELPQKFHTSNVMVEIEAGGVKKSQAYYSHSLAVQIVENYGQLKVTHEKTGKELPKVYVKVYARMKDGTVRFYKDGYTDLRGKLDYTSLSTNELDNVEKLSLLILSETDGAVVREASPPKQ